MIGTKYLARVCRSRLIETTDSNVGLGGHHENIIHVTIK